MAQSVIPKKEQKVKAVFDAIQNLDDMAEFKAEFKRMFPNDWERVKKVYAEHERRDVKGKGHPMPEPEQYLNNMYKVYRKKLTE